MILFGWTISARNALIITILLYLFCFIEFPIVVMLMSNVAFVDNNDDKTGWNFETFFNIFASHYGLKDIDYKEAVRKQMLVNEYSKPYNVEDALKEVKTEKKKWWLWYWHRRIQWNHNRGNGIYRRSDGVTYWWVIIRS